MNIYFISPIGKTTPMLFDTFVETFRQEGHEIVYMLKDIDIAIWDYYSGLGYMDANVMSHVLENKIPLVVFDATDFGAMSKEIWNHGKWILLSVNKKLVYFMRKMDKTIRYPSWVYPYELIQYPYHDFAPVSKDELFNRPYDICFIGNTSPTRAALLTGLMKYKCFNIDCQFITGERIPHDQWLERHRKAKLFISACGGGFTDERKQQLITIAPMLRNKSNHLVVNDYTDKEDCIEVNENPTQADVEKILSVLNDKDKLYDIYMKGIERMHTYYNAEYRSKYILSILKQEGII